MKILVCLFILLVLVAIGIAGNANLRLTHQLPVTSLTHRVILVPWAKEVEELTKGSIKIKIFPSETVGKASEQLSMVEYGMMDFSYVIPSYNDFRYVDFNKVKILWSGYYTPYVLFTVRPLTYLDGKINLKGKVIGYNNIQAKEHIEMHGGSPNHRSAADMYTNLSTHLTDGEVCPIESLTAFRLHEVAKYLYIENFGRGTYYVTVNLKVWNSLPKSQQEIILNLSEKYKGISDRLFQESWNNLIKMAQDRGIKIERNDNGRVSNN